MLFLVDALKIATEKVIQSIINIFIFRNVYSTTQIWLSGFYAFIATLYITSKIKSYGFKLFKRVKYSLVPDLEKYELKFDKSCLESINLNDDLANRQDLINDFSKNCKQNSQNDLFSYIFGSSSQSSLLNLIVIIAIEYLNSNYFQNILLSTLCCVSLAFFICFGASFSYSSILSKEWSEALDELNSNTDKSNSSLKSKKILFIYKRELNGATIKDYACLWWSKYDAHSKTIKVELKFLSSLYLNNIEDLLDHFVSNHMSLHETVEEQTQASLLVNDNKKIEKYCVSVPDYYDLGHVLSNRLKKMKFKSKDSWVEFRLFPLIDFKINVFDSTEFKKEKSN